MTQPADKIDPVSVQMNRYDDGRITASMGGKEFGPPDYEIVVRGSRTPLYRESPTLAAVSVIVTEVESGEMVAIFQTLSP